MVGKHFTCLFFCFAAISIAPSFGFGPPSASIIKKLLENYDGDIYPGSNVTEDGTGTTPVSVNLFVRSIKDIDDKQMTFKTQLTFRMGWIDPRLKYDEKIGQETINYLMVPPSLRSKMWKPDLFFSNEIEYQKHIGLVDNEYFKVHPNGFVLYSARISLLLSCPMSFKEFPFDKILCSLRMASYGYTADYVKFFWKPLDPVQVTHGLYMVDKSLDKFTTDYCDSQSNAGVWSCLRLDLQFVRESAFYITTIYWPMVIAIFFLWLSMWINPKQRLGPRLAFFGGALAFYVCKASSDPLNGVKLSYSTSLDKWNCWCNFFALVAILEFFFVVVFTKKGQDDEGSAGDGQRMLGKRGIVERIKKGAWQEKMEWVIRIVYPIAFILFVGCYFTIYKRGEDQEE